MQFARDRSGTPGWVCVDVPDHFRLEARVQRESREVDQPAAMAELSTSREIRVA
jgi:hypothetical protein